MRRTSIFVVIAIIGTACLARAAGPELKTDEDKTFYALGLALSDSLGPFDLSRAELEVVKAGLTDGVLKHEHPGISRQEYMPKIQALVKARNAAAAAKEKEAGKAFIEKAAKEKGAVKTDSGLVFIDIKPGKGESPKATDTVKVNYKGMLTDGTEFDSSYKRGQPAVFPLNRVIHCWTEGVQKMKVGGKAKLICPSDIAYGDHGSPPKIKPGATLVFEVELLEIVKKDEKAAPKMQAPKKEAPKATH